VAFRGDCAEFIAPPFYFILFYFYFYFITKHTPRGSAQRTAHSHRGGRQTSENFLQSSNKPSRLTPIPYSSVMRPRAAPGSLQVSSAAVHQAIRAHRKMQGPCLPCYAHPRQAKPPNHKFTVRQLNSFDVSGGGWLSVRRSRC